jgi:hypothetical protein
MFSMNLKQAAVNSFLMGTVLGLLHYFGVF